MTRAELADKYYEVVEVADGSECTVDAAWDFGEAVRITDRLAEENPGKYYEVREYRCMTCEAYTRGVKPEWLEE